MCGIAGILNNSGQPVEQGLLDAMAHMLHHRGPDGTGHYARGGIGLAHARLSIIDLEGGAQPIHNEDRSVWVVFNGEIFNYIELRSELQQRGHAFYTRSDTEVIVHLYEEHGEEFANHLNGQFAVAIWDERNRKLVLARDRAGILPLFYTRQEDRLLFASEVKSILAAVGDAPRLNPRALDQLMTFWAPISPETVFEGVFEVSPGQIVTVCDGRMSKRRYWDWTFPSHGEYRTGSEQELAEQLHDLLVDATRLRLRSDVPVGAYLSGGLDSSVLVSIIHHHGGVPLRTFSLGFEDTSLDEGSHQRTLIDHLGADHSQVQCRNEDIADRFLQTIWHTESPVLRTAPVPMGMLSGLAHDQGYKVVLTGEGADEALGGYDIFKESKIRQFWAKVPDSRMRPLLLKRLYPYLDLSHVQAQAYLQSFYGVALDRPDLPYFSHIPRWMTTARCKEFFSDGLKGSLMDDAIDTLGQTLPETLQQWHPFNRSQHLEAKSLLPGYLLCSQGDRMLMSHSVEGRFPFLDHRVIEFANSLDPRFKMKVLNEKYLLKKAMGRYLPQSIVKRYKQPYRAPDIPAFFSGRPAEYVEELLAEDTVRRYGYFDANKVGRLVKKIRRGHAIGYKDNMALVGILSTQAWHHLFVDRYHKNFTDGMCSADKPVSAT